MNPDFAAPLLVPKLFPNCNSRGNALDCFLRHGRLCNRATVAFSHQPQLKIRPGSFHKWENAKNWFQSNVPICEPPRFLPTLCVTAGRWRSNDHRSKMFQRCDGTASDVMHGKKCLRQWSRIELHICRITTKNGEKNSSGRCSSAMLSSKTFTAYMTHTFNIQPKVQCFTYSSQL